MIDGEKDLVPCEIGTEINQRLDRAARRHILQLALNAAEVVPLGERRFGHAAPKAWRLMLETTLEPEELLVLRDSTVNITVDKKATYEAPTQPNDGRCCT